MQKVSDCLASEPDIRFGVLNEDEAVSAFADDCSLEQAGLALSFLQDLDALDEGFFGQHLVEAEPGVYCADKGLSAEYKRLLEHVQLILRRRQKPVSEQTLYEDLAVHLGRALAATETALLVRTFAVSPSVMRLHNGKIAFSEWTEFPKRDSASLAEATLRLLGRPAHFREIAHKIVVFFPDAVSVNERTLNNALVRNQHKFVWVKTGTYGLADWGLKRPPFVKDRLIELLSEARYPLPFWHLKEKVLEVCNCKDESVHMTLDLNPKLFRKFDGDQYGLWEHYKA